MAAIIDWGAIASVVPKLTEQFNTKYQSNQLGIAEANARAAEANAAGISAKPKSNVAIWIAAIVAVLVIAYFLTKNKK